MTNVFAVCMQHLAPEDFETNCCSGGGESVCGENKKTFFL